MRRNSRAIKPRTLRSQAGLTLVELMIAVAIGTILMIGVIQLFSGMRGAYTLNESMSRVQESGRFAIDYMTSDLRMAGHMGCMSNPERIDFYSHIDGEDDFFTRFMQGIEGFEAVGTGPGDNLPITALTPETPNDGDQWSPALPSVLAGQVVEGSDVLVVRYMS
ncbi:PilW family protein, partial [Natronospira sp.]